MENIFVCFVNLYYEVTGPVYLMNNQYGVNSIWFDWWLRQHADRIQDSLACYLAETCR